MIQRLHELQRENDKSHLSRLPQDSQAETTQTSSISTPQLEKREREHRDRREEEEEEEERKQKTGESSKSALKFCKPSSHLGSVLKNSGYSPQNSGPSSARLLPDFVYQASHESASRESEDRQGGGGGRSRAVKENGRKAKQKLNFASTSSCRTEEEVERNDSSDQSTSTASWSEMSSILIGSDYCLSPLSPAMEQRLILQYLTPLGDFQEVSLNKPCCEIFLPCHFSTTHIP